jgi:hypothetical protein
MNISVAENKHTDQAFTYASAVTGRVDTKWRFQFFAKYDYRFLSDVIIAIIATFFA